MGHERQAHEAVPLRARWPEPFGVRTPSATGIARAIQTESGEARLPAQALSRALHWWTQAPSYLVAVAAGRVRDTEAGVPDGVQREAAAEALRQHALRRAAAAEHGVTLQLNAIFPPFMPIAAPNDDT